MINSIQNRLLVTTTCVLALFLTITGWVLDRSFTSSVVSGAQEQLQLVIYSLMGSIDENAGTLSIGDSLSEPRLTQPESGLYALVADDIGQSIWTSTSAVTTGVEFPPADLQPGFFQFSEVAGDVPRYALSYAVIWEDVDTERVVFSVVTDQAPYRASIRQFRQSLGVGFGAATLLFIIAQLLALRWGLLPLRTMAEEVQQLESGEREELSDGYPRELDGLAQNLDRFVVHEQRSRSRYRNALEDLAHSLKTPLAVVRNSLLEREPNKTLLQEQLDRMETTVTHQLSKASASGPVVVGKAVAIAPLVQRLLRALEAAYVSRGIAVTDECDKSAVAKGDERDFLEILGNLIENAFKYTQTRVHVRVARPEAGEYTVIVDIEDDGPGIPADLRAEVLNRGRRLDEIENGQGIGLSVVAELVALYEGELMIGVSKLGGAKISVTL